MFGPLNEFDRFVQPVMLYEDHKINIAQFVIIVLRDLIIIVCQYQHVSHIRSLSIYI